MLFAITMSLSGAEVPKAPVPKSPYLPIIYRYADTLLEHGRDIYGPQKTGLFLSALDRHTLRPLTNHPSAPEGMREDDRVGAKGQPLTGANPQHDENLLRLLYTLSELSAKPKYRDAADAELKWFFISRTSPESSFFLSERTMWDVMKDEPIAAGESKSGTLEFFRPWVLWDRCFELVRDNTDRQALALRVEEIAKRSSGGNVTLLRQAGFYIRTLAVAYARTKDEQFLKAIEALLAKSERKDGPDAGLSTSLLSLAIDCDGAAHRVPEKLAARLRDFAEELDRIFCALPHDLKGTGGFLTTLDRSSEKSKHSQTALWETRHDRATTAQAGMMCVSRYDNTGKLAYGSLIVRAADAYHSSLLRTDQDAWPLTFGQAISLQLAAWRHTARPLYLEHARNLADIAVEKFWGQNPLPKASFKTDHYESITGADTLALALVELHLNILHITAVRCPPNTIDR
jgi:hypothetical protein